MIEWLKNYSGISSTNEVNTERAELQFLRKEMVKYNKSYKGNDTHAATDDESEEDDEEYDKFEAELKEKKAKNAAKGQRTSVSAEAYGNFNKKKEFIPRVIEKTEDQKQRIIDTLAKSFLFNTLQPKEKETVLMAFEEKRFKNGDEVIREGDQGEILFLIESGYYECFKKFVSKFVNYKSQTK